MLAKPVIVEEGEVIPARCALVVIHPPSPVYGCAV